MRIIAFKKLREFYEKHNNAEQALKAWFNEVENAQWDNNHQIKIDYPSASVLKVNRICFNIKGNHYRLIVKINFKFKMVYIRFVGTHKQYDKINADTI